MATKARGGSSSAVRARRLSDTALRALVRLVPQEPQRVFAVTLAVGCVCGLVAVLFHLAIRGLEAALIGPALSARGSAFVVRTLLTTTLGALACGALLHLVPQARGSGIPQVKYIYGARSGRVRLRDAVAKFFIASLQLGSGSSLGREGPTVQICAGIASAMGRLFALSPRNVRRLLPVGAAAGIAAAFNAPIAAVTFVTEEIVRGLDQTVLSGVVVAAALAAVIERSILGENPVFGVPRGYGLDHASSLLSYALLGVAAALLSRVFCGGLLALRARASGLRGRFRWALPALGGLVTGVIAVVVALTLEVGGVTGGGYETLSEALAGGLSLRVMVALVLAKIVATTFCYSSGGAGGIFAPVLFIGGMLGGVFGHLDRSLLGHADVSVGAFALVGMGAFFAAVIRAPMTSVLIIFEMTDGYGLVLPLMIANAVAYLIAWRLQRVPIYEALLEQDGLRLPNSQDAATTLAGLQVAEAMTTELVMLPVELSVGRALQRVDVHELSVYPVVADGQQLLGLISAARLRRRVAEGRAEDAIGQHVRPEPYLLSDAMLVDAVVQMTELGSRQMAVVDAAAPDRVVGMLAMSDVMRAYAQAAQGPPDDSIANAPSIRPAVSFRSRDTRL
jgi:CIC family chloride channel protein